MSQNAFGLFHGFNVHNDEDEIKILELDENGLPSKFELVHRVPRPLPEFTFPTVSRSLPLTKRIAEQVAEQLGMPMIKMFVVKSVAIAMNHTKFTIVFSNPTVLRDENDKPVSKKRYAASSSSSSGGGGGGSARAQQKPPEVFGLQQFLNAERLKQQEESRAKKAAEMARLAAVQRAQLKHRDVSAAELKALREALNNYEPGIIGQIDSYYHDYDPQANAPHLRLPVLKSSDYNLTTDRFVYDFDNTDRTYMEQFQDYVFSHADPLFITDKVSLLLKQNAHLNPAGQINPAQSIHRSKFISSTHRGQHHVVIPDFDEMLVKIMSLPVYEPFAFGARRGHVNPQIMQNRVTLIRDANAILRLLLCGVHSSGNWFSRTVSSSDGGHNHVRHLLYHNAQHSFNLDDEAIAYLERPALHARSQHGDNASRAFTESYDFLFGTFASLPPPLSIDNSGHLTPYPPHHVTNSPRYYIEGDTQFHSHVLEIRHDRNRPGTLTIQIHDNRLDYRQSFPSHQIIAEASPLWRQAPAHDASSAARRLSRQQRQNRRQRRQQSADTLAANVRSLPTELQDMILEHVDDPDFQGVPLNDFMRSHGVDETDLDVSDNNNNWAISENEANNEEFCVNLQRMMPLLLQACLLQYNGSFFASENWGSAGGPTKLGWNLGK